MNTSTFNIETLNTSTSRGRLRATSFDLILFRIPDNQIWDEGVGYDFAKGKRNNVDRKLYNDTAPASTF